jgi:hypothetical protein
MKKYVKEYKGHKVPDGATHWLVNGFAKRDDNNESVSVIGCFQGATWRKCSYGMLQNAIELPEEPKADEWMPKIGEECVVSYPYEDGNFKCFNGEKVLIISCGRCEMTSKYVYTGHNTKHGYVALSAKGFRPLKTEEEKKREAIKEIVINSIDTSKFKISEMGAIAEFLNQMIDKFDVIPAGDK